MDVDFVFDFVDFDSTLDFDSEEEDEVVDFGYVDLYGIYEIAPAPTPMS